jgi:NTP pyrophosphatase (non-canonical NTP hydrolase)
MTTIDRPSRFLNWAHETFGDVALDPRERVLRFLEEAVELAQSLGVSMDTTDALVARVYRRAPGDPVREIGQALATLELLAKAAKIDADAEATKEFYRVQKIPKEEWARRHAAKVAIGIAS